MAFKFVWAALTLIIFNLSAGLIVPSGWSASSSGEYVMSNVSYREWTSAQNECHQNGLKLASLHSDADYAEVHNLVSSSATYGGWLGGVKQTSSDSWWTFTAIDNDDDSPYDYPSAAAGDYPWGTSKDGKEPTGTENYLVARVSSGSLHAVSGILSVDKAANAVCNEAYTTTTATPTTVPTAVLSVPTSSPLTATPTTVPTPALAVPTSSPLTVPSTTNQPNTASPTTGRPTTSEPSLSPTDSAAPSTASTSSPSTTLSPTTHKPTTTFIPTVFVPMTTAATTTTATNTESVTTATPTSNGQDVDKDEQGEDGDTNEDEQGEENKSASGGNVGSFEQQNLYIVIAVCILSSVLVCFFAIWLRRKFKNAQEAKSRALAEMTQQQQQNTNGANDDTINIENVVPQQNIANMRMTATGTAGMQSEADERRSRILSAFHEDMYIDQPEEPEVTPGNTTRGNSFAIEETDTDHDRVPNKMTADGAGTDIAIEMLANSQEEGQGQTRPNLDAQEVSSDSSLDNELYFADPPHTNNETVR